MIAKDFVGYIEGLDITKIPPNHLAYPSKNVLIHKGTAYKRPGITNDGNAPTGEFKIIGEKVWKDALGGERPLRVTKDGRVQCKINGKWLTIYSGISNTAVRVRFDTWIDDSGTIVKKRIFFVDGTDAIYEWNGAIATIATVNAAGQIVTFSEDSTGLKLGFDPGDSTPQPVQIIRFVAGEAQAPDAYETDSDMTTQGIHMTGAFTNVPTAGDLVMGAVIKHTDKLAGIDKDDIYVYKNHVGVAKLESITVYFSNSETKLNFTPDDPSSRTGISAFFVNLDQNYTAMISRFDNSLKASVLWISSVDDWVKINALDAADPTTAEWINVEQVMQAERTGALPFCVSQQKGDIIFFAQDKTLQRIMTVDVLAKDTLKLLSDEVETLLTRLDSTEARIIYLKRYIYIMFPAESTVVALDVVENHFQPPWTLPVQSMSIIDGVLYGHSNSRDETFSMLTGTSDLGAEIVSVFAFGYYQGYQRINKTNHVTQDFFRKQANKYAVSGRLSASTKVEVQNLYENEAENGQDIYTVDGAVIKTYGTPDDQGWATHIWGTASYGGGDDPANPKRRFLAFRAYNAVQWFEFTTILTVSGKDSIFELLAWYIDDSLGDSTIPEDLYIPRVGT